MQYSIAAFKLKSPFIQSLRMKMRARRLSPRTEDSYIQWTAKFFDWTGWRKPDALTGQMVTDYLSHLAAERKVSASTQSQAFNALLFLFRYGLEKEFGEIKAERATRVANVPEILTKEELQSICRELSGDWLLLTQLGYGTGLRLMELLRLRVKDFDFGNGLIAVHDGKGGKNRVVPMPKSMAKVLQAKLEGVRAIHNADLSAGFGSVWLPGELAKKYPSASTSFKWQWAFPSREICKADDGTLRRHHLFPNGFQSALREAAKRSGIFKRVSPHILRHSHATALLEMGRSITEVQSRLGHSDVRTTMVYLHCVDTKKMPSPIDCLCEHG